MKLLIVAGGQGTRLGLKDIPKPMVMVGGKPVLQYQVELARQHGLKDIYFLTGHLSRVIEDHFGDGSRFGVHITYVIEKEPLGTAGAVKALEAAIDERFMVTYGDLLMGMDLSRFMAFDRLHPDVIASIMVQRHDHPYDSDLVEMDDAGTITAFHSKPHPMGANYQNLVNAAIYIFSPRIFSYIKSGCSLDFGRDILPLLLHSNEPIKAYLLTEYLKDVGTPDRLDDARRDAREGKIGGFSGERQEKSKT